MAKAFASFASGYGVMSARPSASWPSALQRVVFGRAASWPRGPPAAGRSHCRVAAAVLALQPTVARAFPLRVLQAAGEAHEAAIDYYASLAESASQDDDMRSLVFATSVTALVCMVVMLAVVFCFGPRRSKEGLLDAECGSAEAEAPCEGNAVLNLFFPGASLAESFDALLLEGLSDLGAKETSLAALSAELSERRFGQGSTVLASLVGPRPCVEELRALHLEELVVLGYRAALGAPSEPEEPKAPPDPPRPGAFDGRWLHRGDAHSHVEVVQGDRIRLSAGRSRRLRLLSGSSCIVKLRGVEHRATLRDDEVHWDDGNVWVRAPEPGHTLPFLPGTWLHSAGARIVITQDGEYLTIRNPKLGERRILLSDFEHGHHIRYFGHRGVMRDDVITWSNGTTWTKVDGGDVAHAAFGDVERSEAQDAELEAADAVAPGDEPGLSDADFWEEALQREAAPEDSQPLFVAPCMADAECDAAEADPSPTRPLVTLPFTPRDGGEAPCAATGDGAPGEETSLRSAFSFADPCGPSPLAGDATARSDGADLPTWPEAAAAPRRSRRGADLAKRRSRLPPQAEDPRSGCGGSLESWNRGLRLLEGSGASIAMALAAGAPPSSRDSAAWPSPAPGERTEGDAAPAACCAPGECPGAGRRPAGETRSAPGREEVI